MRRAYFYGQKPRHEDIMKEGGSPAVGWNRNVQLSKGAARVVWGLLQGDAPEALFRMLGNLKGPLMKIAQLSAVIPDFLPQPYAEALERLQAHAPSMSGPFVRRRMQTELGTDWQKHFASFQTTPTFAASLGQVHKASLLDGQEVACKLQYPDMHAVLQQDLRYFSTFCRLYERYGGALKTSLLQEELQEHLLKELDYGQEAKHMGWFSEALSDHPEVRVPQTIHRLSTDRLLTMTWCEGHPFVEAFQLGQEQKNDLGKTLFLAWYKPFYQYGLLHADPHYGNYTWTKTHLNIVDFGCVRVFSPQFIQSVFFLYDALEKGDKEKEIEAYRLWGFENLDHQLIDILSLWARFLYHPLLEDRVMGIQQEGQYAKRLALHVHDLLRQRGGITPPREFLWMDRATVGIGSALIHLKAQQNWYRLFHHIREGWTSEAVYQRQKFFLS
jgi:predicted unusual protein kinase regulating ubiquinone biosynthesis (AarF/ABC1/UbiB family)